MTEPITVHCGKCGHQRTLCYAPVPVDVFTALSKLPCESCRSKDIRMGPLPKPTGDGDALGWITNGDTGISSEAIWAVMMGRRPKDRHFNYPHDPSDFGRCYRLLKVMPSWRDRMPEVAAKLPEWKPLVDAWDELTALYEEELPAGTAPRLYRRMKELMEPDHAW